MQIFIIHEGSLDWTGVIKRQWGCQQRQFSAFLLAISLEALEIRPALLYSIILSLTAFSLTPKYVTLNGHFMLNCFCTGTSMSRIFA